MSTWYFYDNAGQKRGPITGGQLKGVAKAGQITPETVVETEEGRTAPAKKVKGLMFCEATPKTVVPQQNPFAPMPVPDAVNPFAAPAVEEFNKRSGNKLLRGMSKKEWTPMQRFVALPIFVLIMIVIFVIPMRIASHERNEAIRKAEKQRIWAQQQREREQQDLENLKRKHAEELERKQRENDRTRRQRAEAAVYDRLYGN